ncbi:MAG: NADH-quinone oxidoreductase subunit N [Planctomycetota bacterium]|nr:MAG: NADH-quinone oxidoreductase subunit N [Planctomycetota bacterium]
MELGLTANDWLLAAPFLWLAGAGVLVLIWDAVRPQPLAEGIVSWIGLGLAAVACLPILEAVRTEPVEAFSGMLSVNVPVIVLAILCLGAAAFCGIVAWRSLLPYEGGRHTTAFWTLLLFSTFGMVLTLWANHMATLFLGVECLSLPLYVLVALRRDQSDSIEAGLKYFLLGAFASGFMAFGMAMVYAATGDMSPAAISAAAEGSSLGVFGVALLLIALLFKVAAVPFHLWVADVYQGAPTPVTALMATGTKAATVAALLRWAPGGELMGPQSWAMLGCLTLLIGNLTALNQSNLKRMLALSGVAHVGILLFAFAARAAAETAEATSQIGDTLGYYLVAYGLAATAAFGALELLERRVGHSESASLQGIARRQPLLAGVLCIALLSLAGFPLTAGFLAKYFVFVEMIRHGLSSWAVIGILLTLFGFAYYLKALVTLFMQEPPEERPSLWRPDWVATMALLVPTVLSVVFGVWPKAIQL